VLTAIDMATLLDPGEPEVWAAADRARETLAGLAAEPFLNCLEAALARSPEGPGHPAALAQQRVRNARVTTL
jgi:hypothetical protein